MLMCLFLRKNESGREHEWNKVDRNKMADVVGWGGGEEGWGGGGGEKEGGGGGSGGGGGGGGGGRVRGLHFGNMTQYLDWEK